MLARRKLRVWMIAACAAIFGGYFFSSSSASAQSISQLVSLGMISKAQEQLEKTNPSALDRLFFQGQVLKSSGDFQQAIKVFREILSRDPLYINARRELAHTLLITGRYSAARVNFVRLLEIDQNAEMRAGYRNFLNLVDRQKPSGLSGYFTLLPSTNINRGTENTVFDTDLGQFIIAPGNQPASGVGYQLGVSGFFRQLLTSKSRLVLNWGISGIAYDTSAYNRATGKLSLSYEQAMDNGGWAFTPYTNYSWQEGGDTMRGIGLRFTLDQKISENAQISVNLRHEYRDYFSRSYLSGDFSSARFALGYSVNPRFSLNAGVVFENSNPEAAHLQYSSYKGFAGISNTWENGLETSFGVEVGSRGFEGNFPLTSTPREDQYYGVKFSLQNSRTNYAGFTPRISCAYTNNRSNIALYVYDATECQITVSKEF